MHLSLGCCLVGVGIGPAIEVINQNGNLCASLQGIELHSSLAIELCECFALWLWNNGWCLVLLEHKDAPSGLFALRVKC